MKLHVFPPSPNSRKCMFASREFGLNLPESIVDLKAGAQKSPEAIALNPNGKMPVLEYDDGTSLWESNAIVNRLAAEVETTAWPKTNARYDIMRWQFWEQAHFAPAAGKFIAKVFFGNDSIDLDAATKDFAILAGVLDGHLDGRDWLVGDAMTTADIVVSAILCYRDMCGIPTAPHANITRWLSNVEAREAWQAANKMPEPA